MDQIKSQIHHRIRKGNQNRTAQQLGTLRKLAQAIYSHHAGQRLQQDKLMGRAQADRA